MQEAAAYAGERAEQSEGAARAQLQGKKAEVLASILNACP